MFRPQTRRIVGRIFEALNSLKAKFRRINNYRQSQGRLFNVRSFVMANIFLAFTFAKIHMEDNRDERIKGLKTLIKVFLDLVRHKFVLQQIYQKERFIISKEISMAGLNPS
jgi:hypothetical protein